MHLKLPTFPENISDFGTTVLSSYHMDGFFISRPCDTSQLFVA